jgi:hypothetical protein
MYQGTIVAGRISQSPETQTRRDIKHKTKPQDQMPEALTREKERERGGGGGG